jgi:hypothetical protein
MTEATDLINEATKLAKANEECAAGSPTGRASGWGIPPRTPSFASVSFVASFMGSVIFAPSVASTASEQ